MDGNSQAASRGDLDDLARDKLNHLRTKLLDLTRRNALLNFRFPQRSPSAIRIVDAYLDPLHRCLVESGAALIFEGVPDPENDTRADQTARAAETASRLPDRLDTSGESSEDPAPTHAGDVDGREERNRPGTSHGAADGGGKAESDTAIVARALGWNIDLELRTISRGSTGSIPNHGDRIRTLLFESRMEAALGRVRDRARLSLQERGVNSLFLAFGFLEWYESDTSAACLAPLLLHAVDLERKIVRRRYRFSLSSLGEGTESNATLRERLRRDFGIELPEFDESDSCESYFESVRESIAGMRRWVVRRYVTLGTFFFTRLVMHEDLGPTSWPEHESLERQPVLRALLVGSTDDDVGSNSEDDRDTGDATIEAKVPLVISDADGSQLSAISEALSGRSMAIQGPPGTGKSQTITNLIAAALALGKKVLFVAEKTAALEVVKKRLDDARLGDFCFELHSTKSKRSTILESLRRRLERDRNREPRDFDAILREHHVHRAHLSRYAEKMNSLVGSGGATLHDLLWGYVRAHDGMCQRGLTVDSSLPHVDNAAEWSKPEVASKRLALVGLETKARAIVDSYGTIESHPWAFLGVDVRSSFEVEDILQTIRKWKISLEDLGKVLRECESTLSHPFGESVQAGHDLLESLRLVSGEVEDIAAPLFASLRSEATQQKVEAFLRDREYLGAVLESLRHALPVYEERPPPRGVLADVYEVIRASPLRTVVADHRVQHLDAEITSLSSLARRANNLVGVARRVARALEREDSVSGRAIEAFVVAVRVYRETPGDVLKRRSGALMDERNRRHLAVLAADAQRLREDDQRLQEWCVLSYEDDAQLYRDCSAALRTAGLFERFFGREFKQATKVWRVVQRSRRKAKAFEMAAELDAIATQLERHQAFCSNDRAREICGEEFRGLSTPFAELCSVAEFAETIAARVGGSDPVSCRLRVMLLEEDLGRLERTLGWLTDAEADGIEKEVRNLSAIDSELLEGPVEELAQAVTERAERLGQARQRLRDLSVASDVRIADLPKLDDLVSELHTARARLDENGDTWALLDNAGVADPACAERVRRTLALARDLLQRPLPTYLLDYCFASEASARLKRAAQIRATLDDVLSSERAPRDLLVERYGIDPRSIARGDVGLSFSVEQMIENLNERLDSSETRANWLELCRLRQSAVAAGLEGVVQFAWKAPERVRNMQALFDLVYHTSVLKPIFAADEELAQFSGTGLSGIRRRFQELDKKLIQLQREKLAWDLEAIQIPRGVGVGAKRDWSELALIENELRKQKRHLPVRKLVERARNALLAMKPCWMMSPLSVAQFIPSGLRLFDLVVIDEASQIRPEEALGAAARGSQLVVVGDRMQLPPTSFFDRSEDPDESEAAEENDEQESILDLTMTAFRSRRTLRWHYRSRHESLIAFSNDRFYENKLIVFPSPTSRKGALGVEFVYVKGLYSKGGTNGSELTAVCEAAVDFMRASPDKSLGIVTINQAQAELVRERLDGLMQVTPEAADYRERWESSIEPVFVKSLEHVQGDERDVIFVSTVYGPLDEGGRVYQRFGPINSANGHRRLNVLFTRAKERLVVFSSMRSSDIRVEDGSREGLKVLQAYLEYAETGRLEQGAKTGRPPDSDFEVAVADCLRQHGYEVVAQVGVAGFFIDIGVRSRSHPDRFLVGVECDGASYHSAKFARDRDRLRQEVLEDRGWTLYRVWSTDWFGDRNREEGNLVSFIRECERAEARREEASSRMDSC